MTVHVTVGGAAYRDLWQAALYDSSMAVAGMRPDGRGKYFADMVADLLVGAGRIQPTMITSPRAVTRTDLGRVQVGLANTRRDVAIVHAQHLTAQDARLLHLCTHRAGVDLYLLCETEPDGKLAAWIEASAVLVEASEPLEQFAARPGHDGRREAWDCHAALELGSGVGSACNRHASATECVLAWFPHAVITARVSPPAVRA